MISLVVLVVVLALGYAAFRRLGEVSSSRGPLACLALLIAAVWIETAAPSWRHR